MQNAEHTNKSKWRRSLSYFLGSLAIALVFTFLLKERFFTDSQVYVLFLLFFAVSLWITEAIPPFAVSLFIMAYLVYTFGNPNFNSAPEKIDRYVNTFSSNVIWLLLGGFFMAAAMQKSGLDKRMLKLTLRISGSKPRNILIAVMVAAWLSAMLISDTATTSMIVAALTPMLTSLGKSSVSKALLVGVALAATLGGMGTLMANVTNATAAGLLEKEDITIGFLDWMMYGVPVSFVLLMAACYALIYKFLRNEQPVSLAFLHNKTMEQTTSRNTTAIVGMVIVVTILFWLTGSLHGIPVASIAAIPIVILTATGILTAHDLKTLPWDTLFLVAGGLSLGEALQTTKIFDYYALHLASMSIHPILFLIALSYTAMIFANLSSGLACIMLLIPLGMAVLPTYKTEVCISVGLSVTATVFLPVSIPPNVVVYGTGLLDQKDFRIGGLVVGILGPLLAVFWSLLHSA